MSWTLWLWYGMWVMVMLTFDYPYHERTLPRGVKFRLSSPPEAELMWTITRQILNFLRSQPLSQFRSCAAEISFLVFILDLEVIESSISVEHMMVFSKKVQMERMCQWNIHWTLEKFPCTLQSCGWILYQHLHEERQILELRRQITKVRSRNEPSSNQPRSRRRTSLQSWNLNRRLW